MADLGGARVALLESRMSSELANLVRRHGGVPTSVPSLREEPVDARPATAELLDALRAGDVQVVVFMTGVGAKHLFAAAEQLGRAEELAAALQNVTTVCRGPKPVAVLRGKGVQISVTAPEPNTTKQLLEALAVRPLDGRGVALLHYGERNAPLADALRARGANLRELYLYEWRLPEETGPLRALVDDLIAGSYDVVAFTSQIQVRHLFQLAAERSDALAGALNDRVLTASIGPTTTGTLRQLGVKPRVEPEHPKMGHLVTALAEHLARTR